MTPDNERPQPNVRDGIIIAVCSLLIMVLLIAEIIVGGVFNGDCPRQPFIPTYLQGFAAVMLIVYWLNMCNLCNVIGYCMTGLFLVCWFIAGSIAIYSIYEPNYNKNATKAGLYCNKTLYLFSFWSTTLTYAFIVIIVYHCCCRRRQQDDEEAQTLVQG